MFRMPSSFYTRIRLVYTHFYEHNECSHVSPHRTMHEKPPEKSQVHKVQKKKTHTHEHIGERLICGKYLNGLLSERNSNGDAVYKWMDARSLDVVCIEIWRTGLGIFFFSFSRVGKMPSVFFLFLCAGELGFTNENALFSALFFSSLSPTLRVYGAMHRSIDSHGAYANGSKASVCRTICFVACRR